MQTPNTAEYSLGDRAPGANVRTQEGNNPDRQDRKSTRLNSSHLVISYAVFCLKKKNILHPSCPWPVRFLVPRSHHLHFIRLYSPWHLQQRLLYHTLARSNVQTQRSCGLLLIND